MRNKKVITSIIVIMFLMISSQIYAAIQIDSDGNGETETYYTKDDLEFRGYKIRFNGDEYWCINHNWTLTGGMGGDEDLQPQIDQKSSNRYR